MLFLIGSVLISYVLGILISKKRWTMWIGILAFSIYLLLIKLKPVTGMELLAPLGFSYYALQVISYLADVYRGKYAPEHNLIKFALFLTYLPHLFIGPIERYDSMMLALQKKNAITWEGIGNGLIRILWGAVKKLVIAARVGVIVGAISSDVGVYNGAYALAAMLLYSVQLYADFSGGIDMVLGISQMLGIKLSENFDAPYFSQSIQEFWRRWHITLGSWLREYVYIPLGGNRKGRVRKTLNIIATFTISGIWHGVQYLVWGLFNGLFVACGTSLQTKWKTFNRITTFLLISLLWSFFIWPNMHTSISMVFSVFTQFNYVTFFAGIGALGLSSGDWIVLLVFTVTLWLYDWKSKSVAQFISGCNGTVKTAIICFLILVVTVFGMYGIGFNAEAFIYSRF